MHAATRASRHRVVSAYQIFWAANGLEGLEKVREVKPELIMLDYMMPFMNGAAMGEALRGNAASSNIKIVIHSCLAESAVKARFNNYDAYVRKPCDVEIALQLIQNLLGNEQSPFP